MAVGRRRLHSLQEGKQIPFSQGDTDSAEGLIYVNGDFLKPKEATISIFDRGLVYGDGVFDTMMVRYGSIFKLQPHIDRLFRSARAVQIEVPLDNEGLKALVLETARRSRLTNAYIKCAVTRGVKSAPLLDPRGCKPTLIIFVLPYTSAIDPAKAEVGISAKIASIRRVPHEALDARIKSLNYLTFILARLEAIESGCDDAIMLDSQAQVCEAAGSNVFTVREGRVTTPSSSMLEGITRDTVFEICERLSIPCKAALMTSYDVWVADEVFLSSTIGGLTPVVRVDGRTIGTGNPGPTFRAIKAEFETMLERGEHCTRL